MIEIPLGLLIPLCIFAFIGLIVFLILVFAFFSVLFTKNEYYEYDYGEIEYEKGTSNVDKTNNLSNDKD